MVDIDKIEKRIVRSYFDDGILEVALGAFFLFLGGGLCAQAASPRGSNLESVLSAFFIMAIVSAGFVIGRVVRFFKRRVTYPRTGYVSFKKKEPDPKRKIASAVVGGLIGASSAALYALSPSARTLVPAVNGLLVAVAVLLIAHRVGVFRFYLLAAASVIIGFVLTATGNGDLKGAGAYYFVFGAAVLISGLATLAIYLRRSPAAGEEPAEGPDAR